MTVRWMFWIVLAAFVSGPAVGAELYRCVSAAGRVSFQDAPCAEGSQSRTIPVLVDPVPPDTAHTGAKAKPKSSKPGTGKSKAKSDSRVTQRAACDNARRQRDVALDRMGLARTYERLQALDAEVEAACTGL